MHKDRKELRGIPQSPPKTPTYADDPLVGRILKDTYRVDGILGEGGMGRVYSGVHVTLDKKVAIKVLLHRFASDPELRDRFLREARSAAKISHPNVVDISDFGTNVIKDDKGRTILENPFFVMELLQGEDLATRLIRNGVMEWLSASAIFIQTCDALYAAHEKGIVHRDLKPANIFLVKRPDREDFVKVVDFGIAKIQESDPTSPSALKTRTGMLLGTPQYMAPEQILGQEIDSRIDIFGLGTIMYETLCGVRPFNFDYGNMSYFDVHELLRVQAKAIPDPPSKRRPDLNISVAIDALVLRALANDRNQRFQTMPELKDAILHPDKLVTVPELYFAGDTLIDTRDKKPDSLAAVTSEIIPEPIKRNFVARTVAAASALAAVIGIAGFLVSRSNGPTRNDSLTSSPSAVTAPVQEPKPLQPPSTQPAPVPVPAPITPDASVPDVQVTRVEKNAADVEAQKVEKQEEPARKEIKRRTHAPKRTHKQRKDKKTVVDPF